MAYKKRRKRPTSGQYKKLFREIRKWSRQKKLAALLFCVLIATVLISAWLSLDGLYFFRGVTVPLSESDSPAGVHVLDVGQGTAVLFENNGSYALVDAGTPEEANYLVAYLRSAGVQKLDYVVMTHPHADHIGGMEEVLRRFEVGLLVLPDFELAPYPTNSIFAGLMAYAVNNGIPADTALKGNSYPLGAATLEIVHGGLQTKDNYNLMSLAVLYKDADMRVLYTGDAEKMNEKAMLDQGVNVRADIYVAGHHGSSTSNTEAFMLAVRPGICIISCGVANAYGHPDRSALENMEKVRAEIYRTDRMGTIVLKPAQEGFAMGSSGKGLDNAA